MPSSSRQLPAPAPASSLTADDAPLGPYAGAHLIQNSYSAGLAHADALRRLTAGGEVDPTSPWTLLRGALENFATGLWLLDGAGRSERRRRALSLWDEDMRNRQQYETDTGHLPSSGGMTGAQRRAEIRAIPDQLCLAPLTAPRTHQILLTAAPAAGLTAVKVCAAWRAASGSHTAATGPTCAHPSPARRRREPTASTTRVRLGRQGKQVPAGGVGGGGAGGVDGVDGGPGVSEPQEFGGGDRGVGVEGLDPDEPQAFDVAEQPGPFGVAGRQGGHRRVQVTEPAGGLDVERGDRLVERVLQQCVAPPVTTRGQSRARMHGSQARSRWRMRGRRRVWAAVVPGGPGAVVLPPG
ncbi:hypothetical protein ABZ467_35635 [Streptomyces sp. NPDC005727]|uniref:hypothetical protein n=1 Tax=Streptomyces sp. NPDC005727 TaxID=3157053 RepID=UPI0033C7ED8E